MKFVLSPLNGVTITGRAYQNVTGSGLSVLRHHHIPGTAIQWDYADGFERECYPYLVAWVTDYPEQVTVTEGSCGAYPINEFSQSTLMGYPTIRLLDD